MNGTPVDMPRRRGPLLGLLFESTPGWNQVGGPELLTMENHEGIGGWVCFVNASTRFVRPEQVGGLRWIDEPHSP